MGALINEFGLNYMVLKKLRKKFLFYKKIPYIMDEPNGDNHE